VGRLADEERDGDGDESSSAEARDLDPVSRQQVMHSWIGHRVARQRRNG